MKNRFINKLNDTTKPNVMDWVIVLVIIVFCYFSFNHPDLNATSTHGKDLVLCILEGKFFSFYDYTQSTAVYSIVLYLAFAIWSLPVMLIYKIFDLTLWGLLDYGMIPYPVLMWYKLLPTLFFIGISVVIYRIVKYIGLNNNTAKWISFLFVSSPIAIFSQFIFGQYDSIGIFFAVLGLYYFLQKKHYLFSICMSVAITFKMFSFFIFLPLVLLFEKRFLHIIKHLLIGISLYAVTTLMFMGSKGYRDAMAFSGGMAQRLFLVGIPSHFGTISLFPLVMIAICVYAYVFKFRDDYDYITRTLYISFAAFAALFSFILWHPQWVIYLCVFMSLAIILSPNSNASLIIEAFMGVGYIATTILSFANNVDANLMSLGAFKRIYEKKFTVSPTLSVFFSKINIGNNLFFSLFTCSLIVLSVFYLISLSDKRKEHNTLATKNYIAGDRLYILARPISLLIYIVPSFYLLLK
ncbi:MAG: hypothetical protein IKF53_02965 [Clostridia bacterium]|nr:hypothetical protein [Clostridia bacterium]